MPNKQYQKGVRLEREVVNLIKQAGGRAARTAGSHGWVDVVGEVESQSPLEGIFKGFNYTLVDGKEFDIVLVRAGKKYTDVLYLSIYGDIDKVSTLLLIQCKRRLALKRDITKAVKHG
jgi:hypothetical protein